MPADAHASHEEPVFLSAEWRNLLMLNYEVPRGLLDGFVLPGTELDSFAGKFFVSLVGFQFLRTRMLGRFAIPFHENFDEVNLRFYVCRRHSSGDRSGVVFVREIVPRFAIAQLARWIYGERYLSLPMQDEVSITGNSASLRYRWRNAGVWCGIRGESQSTASLPASGSLEQFITEHYWGYASRSGVRTVEYRVEHPRWHARRCESGALEGDVTSLYGAEFARVLSGTPDSAFIAEGSEVRIFLGRAIT